MAAFENRYKDVKRCGDCPHFGLNPTDKFQTWCDKFKIPVHRKQKPRSEDCPRINEMKPPSKGKHDKDE